MAATSIQHQVIKFGVFEVDLAAGEVRKAGMKQKLAGQPFQVLQTLLEHPQEVVTREELRERLWPDNTFVDYELALKKAVNRLREVLGDSAENPHYIETVPRRGYRFIGTITQGASTTTDSGKARPAGVAENASAEAQSVSRNEPDAGLLRASRARTRLLRYSIVATGVALLIAAASLIYQKAQYPASPKNRTLARLTFDDGLQIGATWSPDGRYIAYSSDRGGKFDIWVQQVSGGDPIQITKGSGHHWQPNWSPDGKYIAYRSEEGDGGIYVIPALGGAGLERKIAPFGYYPKWSPNSLQVLFQINFTVTGHWNRFYVAQLDGSAPREVLAEFIAQKFAGSAAWYPDGKRITVWVGDFSPSPSFWTVPIAGGPGIKLEIAPAVQRKLAEVSGEGETGEQLGDYSFSWSPSGDAVYFERGYRGARNIWKMTVDPETLRATGIDRLTTGPGPDAGAAVSTDGRRLAFTAKSQRIRAWLFPFDATTGYIRGNGDAITSPGRMSAEPTLSRDGTKVAYVVPHGERSGLSSGDVRNEVWVKSLVDGREAPVIADDYSRWFPQWSPDGMQLAYTRRNRRTNEQQIMVWSSQSHEEEPLTTLGSTFGVWDWSPDGKSLLSAHFAAGTLAVTGIWLIPVASAPHAETAAQKITSSGPAYQLYQPHFSPNGRWIVFEAVADSPNPESTLYVVPTSSGPWTRITDSKHWDDKPRWSPDGRTIYFVSRRGGFFNVWGIRFDPAIGRTVGQPFQVSKFESPRLMVPSFIPPVGLSLTQDKLVLTMAEESGSIWVLDNADR
jgi:Tol biopolymer transport system component/DNA-binding winged helix-turn-helix (wHTH) protein